MDVATTVIRFLIEFITGWFFKIVERDFMPENKKLCLLKDWICLQNGLKLDVMNFGSGFKQHFGGAIMKLALFGFMYSLGNSRLKVYIDFIHLLFVGMFLK